MTSYSEGAIGLFVMATALVGVIASVPALVAWHYTRRVRGQEVRP